MWLENLIGKLTCFIPRPIIIQPDEGGFRQHIGLRGTKVTELKPNHWYWIIPLTTEHIVVKTSPQVKDIRIQSISTNDGVDIAIGLSIRYYISDAPKAILKVHDFDESLQNIVLGVVSDYVENRTEEQLRQSRNILKEEILKTVREEASGWGLKIQSVKITDFGKTQNFRILMDDKVGVRISR